MITSHTLFFSVVLLLLNSLPAGAQLASDGKPHPPPPRRSGELVTCSLDGKFYASTSLDGRLQYYRSEDGKVLRTFYHCAAQALAFSPEGRLLVCAGGLTDAQGIIRVWNLVSGALVFSRRIEFSGDPLLAMNRDETLLAIGGPSSHLTVWNVPKTEKLWEINLPSKIAAIEFVKPSCALLAHCEDGKVRAFSCADGAPVNPPLADAAVNR